MISFFFLFSFSNCLLNQKSSNGLDVKEITGIFENHEMLTFTNSQINVFESQFLHCTNFESKPGAIFVDDDISILNCTTSLFSNCTNFGGEGGAIFFYGLYFSVNRTTAELCSATAGGQFIYSKFINRTSHQTSYFCDNVVTKCSNSVEDAVTDSNFFMYGYFHISLCNTTSNTVMFYGCGFSFKANYECALEYCNFFNNTAKNLMYIYDLKNNPYSELCNYVGNKAAAASLFCCYGHYRVSRSLFRDNIGPIATTNWLKEGNVVINQCTFDQNYQITTNVITLNCEIRPNPTLIPFFQ